MPYQVIGREITRGTLCRDRYRAEVTLVCSDRIPVGQRASLWVQIRWRAGSRPGRPGDAAPIQLQLRSLSPNAGGSLRFEGPTGPTEKTFTGDVTTLLTLYGQTASPGQADDVRLAVNIEGETRGTLALSVAAPSHYLQIRAASGEIPPDLIPPHRPMPYRAVVRPPLEGQFQWCTLPAGDLQISGPADQPRVEVVGSDTPAVERVLGVWFIPTAAEAAAPTLFTAMPLALGLEASNSTIPDAFAPATAQVIRAGWRQERARSGEEVTLWVQTSGGQPGQTLTLDIAAVTATGSIPIEQVEWPLGDSEVIAIPWQVPTVIPGVGARSLGFSASLLDQPVAAADADTISRDPGRLYGQLQLQVPLQLQLVDSTGAPLADVSYRLTDRQGQAIAGMAGRTDANGDITLPDLPSDDYILQVEGASVLAATEPPLPDNPAVPDNTVFSFLDVRLDQEAAD